jgi:diacylglycerol kinase family enzyme
VGLIAAIMNLRRQTRHFFGSRTLSFFFSFLLLIFQRMEYMMNIRIDTERIKRRVMTVCVGNASGYGQTPNAVPYNGLLDVSVVYNPKVKQFLEGLWLLVTGRFLNHKSVHPYRTRRMAVESGKSLVSVDGRLIDKPVGKYFIQVEPEVINFLIPD